MNTVTESLHNYVWMYYRSGLADAAAHVRADAACALTRR